MTKQQNRKVINENITNERVWGHAPSGVWGRAPRFYKMKSPMVLEVEGTRYGL